MDTTATPTKWYNKKPLVIILCVLFFPVGLYGLFKSSAFGTVGKSVGAVYLVALLWVIFTDKKPATAVATTTTTGLAPVQADDDDKHTITAELADREQSTVNAATLVEAYEENEVRADNQYKDKYLYVVGVVESINKDILNEPYVMLRSDDGVHSVQCTMASLDEAAAINRGDVVTMHGQVQGKAILFVLLNKCKAVPSLDELQTQLQPH